MNPSNDASRKEKAKDNDSVNENHNARKQALGPNTKR